ncbi:hypothetical protein FRC12_022750 [Ceratobasidium sp. 428]|nr:hypothetical protein FRC12_022750 [Ceratobasidium sp. 428]
MLLKKAHYESDFAELCKDIRELSLRDISDSYWMSLVVMLMQGLSIGTTVEQTPAPITPAPMAQPPASILCCSSPAVYAPIPAPLFSTTSQVLCVLLRVTFAVFPTPQMPNHQADWHMPLHMPATATAPQPPPQSPKLHPLRDPFLPLAAENTPEMQG